MRRYSIFLFGDNMEHDKKIIDGEKTALFLDFDRFINGPFSIPSKIDYCNGIPNTYANSYMLDPEEKIRAIHPPIQITPVFGHSSTVIPFGPDSHYISHGPDGHYISFNYNIGDTQLSFRSPTFAPETGPEGINSIINMLNHECEKKIRAAILADFRNSTPPVRIVLEHELVSDEKCYRIISIENVKGFQELPRKYTGGNTCFYRRECTSTVVDMFSMEFPHKYTIKPGELIGEKGKNWIIKCMKDSIKVLKDIKLEDRKLKRDWVGKIEVIEI